MSKKENKAKPSKKQTRGNMGGMLMLFVVASIVYSTYVVALGTDTIAAKAMVVPQALFAAYVLVQKFSK